MAYAARALTLIVQFWELTNVRRPKNILPCSRHTHLQCRKRIRSTFCSFSLVISSCTRHPFICSSQLVHLVPNLKLSVAILSSSILAFTLALPISHYLEISLDPISLTEALLFFVHVVGFDKPLCLVAAVFNHPHLLSPVKEGRWHG
ncbi:uncharacterized protein EDB91DRAFT_831733 [Suillus paluster]|uniref:uncharacterized protein n=1 Tax=Suillus paluster TaxID=48578 RepID=UPI001B884F9F|nr:uncharacterized protein EDB91DRAFT_831733 [Suillus paluster]KAG1749053.1 hypothetical protein EDB91DRAFT_831733 [Suillus paluster]